MTELIIFAAIGLAMGGAMFALTPGKTRGGIIVAMLLGAGSLVGLLWMVRYIGLTGRASAFLIPMVGTALILAIWRIAMTRESETL